MPIVKLNSIYNLADQGWTETFYRSASSVESGTNVDRDYLLASMAMRPRSAFLEATRGQEVVGYRRMFLDLADTQGQHDGSPGTANVSALCRIDFVGGGYRHIHVRGLPDSLVRMRRSGGDNPPAELLESLQHWFGHMQRLQFRGRLRSREEPWYTVRETSPTEDETPYVRVEVEGDFQPNVGSYVYFGEKGSLHLKPGRAYWVLESDPGSIVLYHPWLDGLPDQPGRGQRVKQLAFEYPAFESLDFVRYSAYRPGPRFRAASWEPFNPRQWPLSPCGRIVDYLRQAYICGMRYRVDDVGVLDNIRWFFPTHRYVISKPTDFIEARPPQTSIPFAHPFGSRNWDLDEWPEIPLGETYARQYHHGRQRAVLAGYGLAGAESIWREGAVGGLPPLKFSPKTGWP